MSKEESISSVLEAMQAGRADMSEGQLALASQDNRRIIWISLALNVAIAAGLFTAGVFGDSSALIANGLDNSSDALVYATSVLAIGRSPGRKRAAARASGIMLLIFGIGVVVNAVHRYFTGSEPIGMTMIMMAPIAAAVNLLSLFLMKRPRGKDVTLSTAKAFGFSHLIPNGGILLGGGLVLWTGQNWPDIVVGIGVAAITVCGAVGILWDAHFEAEKTKED